jgi:phytoene/squalene synthetase
MSEQPTPSHRKFLEHNPQALATGYRSCKKSVDKYFRDQIWMTANLPAAQRRDLDPLLFHGIKVLDLLYLHSDGGMPLDVWQEVRDDLNLAFLEHYVNPELMAVLDVVQRFSIPKQFLFDPIAGADNWIRQSYFDTYDQLDSFLGRTAGSFLLSVVPVLGVTEPDYELAAIEFGKGLMLTELLGRCAVDARQNRIFLARQDLEECEIDIQRLKIRKTCPTLKHLVRLYCWRIEKCFEQGSHLLDHLDFDGRRTMTSLLAWAWKQKTKMQVDPDLVLSEEGVLNRGDKLRLKTRHLLGLEGNLPFQSKHHGH